MLTSCNVNNIFVFSHSIMAEMDPCPRSIDAGRLKVGGITLTDTALWELINKLNAEDLRNFLRNVSVPFSGVRVAELKKRLFYAFKLGLPVSDCEDVSHKKIEQARSDKLKHGLMILPHPLCLENWTSIHTCPDVSVAHVQKYFDCENLKLRNDSGGSKALAEGSSIAKGIGRVQNVAHHVIDEMFGEF